MEEVRKVVECLYPSLQGSLGCLSLLFGSRKVHFDGKKRAFLVLWGGQAAASLWALCVRAD